MKRITCLLLSILILMLAVSPVIALTGPALSLTPALTFFSRGSEVSVTVNLKDCEKCKSIALVFDYDTDNVFEVVGGEWLLSGTLIASFDKTTTKAGTAASAFVAETDANGDIFVLKLKVKDNAPTGNATITATPIIKNGSKNISCSSASAEIKIVNDCQHKSKTLIPEQKPTIQEQGWNPYYKCDNCGQIFLSDGITEVAEIPYRLFEDNFKFICVEGYQVRTKSYNGLRTYYSIDKSKIASIESDGYEILEYGVLFASTDRLIANDAELTVSKNGDTYTSASIIKQLVLHHTSTIYRPHVDFMCTVTYFNESNYNLKVTSRAYAVIKDRLGNETVYYFDYPNEDYRSVSLEQIADLLFKAGKIDETCISYIDVEKFRKKK